MGLVSRVVGGFQFRRRGSKRWECMIVCRWVWRQFEVKQGNLHTIFKTFAELRREHANFLTMSFPDDAKEENIVLVFSV